MAGLVLPILILFSSLALAQPNADYRQDLSILFSKNDIVYFGETHGSGKNAKVLESSLTFLVEHGQIDTFATEMFPHSANPILQQYLNAASDSEAERLEKKLRDHTLGEIGSGWLAYDSFNQLLPTLRKLKLRHGDRFHVCGIDTPPIIGNNKQIVHARAKIMAELTPETIAIMKINKGFDPKSYATNPKDPQFYDWFDREAKMGQDTYNCVANRKKALVHVGNEHAYSVHMKSDKYSFMPMSHYVDKLLKKSRKTAVLEIVTPELSAESGDSDCDLKQNAYANSIEEFSHLSNDILQNLGAPTKKKKSSLKGPLSCLAEHRLDGVLLTKPSASVEYNPAILKEYNRGAQ
jgi:hypothetical protein